jgi:hypothetical protein
MARLPAPTPTKRLSSVLVMARASEEALSIPQRLGLAGAPAAEGLDKTSSLEVAHTARPRRAHLCLSSRAGLTVGGESPTHSGQTAERAPLSVVPMGARQTLLPAVSPSVAG